MYRWLKLDTTFLQHLLMMMRIKLHNKSKLQKNQPNLKLKLNHKLLNQSTEIIKTKVNSKVLLEVKPEEEEAEVASEVEEAAEEAVEKEEKVKKEDKEEAEEEEAEEEEEKE